MKFIRMTLNSKHRTNKKQRKHKKTEKQFPKEYADNT